MEVVRRRSSARNGVVAGSVWDNRMNIDEVKAGMMVFNGEENSEDKRLKRNEKGGGVGGKRKTWKSESSEGTERSPIQIRKTKSGSGRESCKDLGMEKKSIQLRKTRSESNRFSSDEPRKDLGLSVEGSERTPVQIKKTRSESNGLSDESCKDLGVSLDGIERNPVQISKARSISPNFLDETCKEFGVCKEKIISSSLTNVGQIMSPQDGVNGEEEDGVENGEERDIEEEIQIQKSFDVTEINTPELEPKKVVIEEMQLHHIQEKSIPISSNLKKEPLPIKDHPVTNPNPTKSPPISEQYERYPETQNKLQNIVDLVMWRDVSKSAFVFGLGSFILLSSSFTKDLNFSLISAISYLGLLYLAAVYLYKSIICRGAIDIDESDQMYIVVGEEEAIWLLKLILPYLNEFILKLRVLFTGDPVTTMKLAVVLFILARCGSSITIWKMAKLGFFGVFTIPKVCSSYSTQLTAYGKFWIGRFRDAWDSCSHKKAVAFAIFTLVWNLSSVVARIWAVFMLVVAVRYYHQSLIREEWTEDDVVVTEEDTKKEGQIGQRQGRGPTQVEVTKEEKGILRRIGQRACRAR